MPAKECIPVQETLSHDDINSLSLPFDEHLNQEIAVVTAILEFVPQKGEQRRAIILGYKLARLQ